MNQRQAHVSHKAVAIMAVLALLFAASALSAGVAVRASATEPAPSPTVGPAGTPTPQPTPVSGPKNPRGAPPPASLPKGVNALPGYCPSGGGSTLYEYISSATLAPNPTGTMMLTVQVYIANPTGCTAGNPCPEYDASPEYVNAWIDWNGDKVWQASDLVMDKALTGYLSINYHGTMTAIVQFSPPAQVTQNPTAMRVNLGWAHDPNDPCESSWDWGNVLDKQVQFGSPRIKAITAKGIGTANDHPETGKPVRLEADIEVPAGYEVTTCSWTGTLTQGSGSSANKCQYDYTPATGSGPKPATYGEKEVTLTIGYKHTASGVTGQTSKNHKYKVFFRKGAPGSWGDDDGNGIPNWFEYWGMNGAVPGLNAADVMYDQTLGDDTYGFWRPSDDKIHVGGAAALEDPVLTIPAGAKCPAGSFGGTKGIDTAAVTLAHERRHKTIHHNWDAGGIWAGPPPLADSDDTNHPTKDDLPADDLPDTYENTIGTDPAKIDSCDLEHRIDGDYKYYGDNELDARRAEIGVRGKPESDWANLGKQTTPIFSDIPAALPAPGATPSRRSGAAGPQAPYAAGAIAAAAALGALTGSYTDSGVDANGDGLYESLKLSVGVQINQQSSYNVVAWLGDGSGAGIAWASAKGPLGVGTHTVDVLFDGLAIRAHGLDGPYRITRVELRGGPEERLSDAADNASTTAAYQYTKFTPPVAGFTHAFSDSGIDSDSDGRYNLLRIKIGLAVRTAGAYTITGELEGSTLVAVASTTVVLAGGSQTVDLDFSGQLVFQRRQDGPYRLKALRIEDTAGARVDFVFAAYTTGAYSYGQFQHSGTSVDAASYSNQGIDLNGDGKYDYLRVQFRIDIEHQAEYRILATLDDSEGLSFTSIVQDLALAPGSATISLDFRGSAISGHGMDGPYQVTSVAVLDGSGAIIDYQQSAHTTGSYKATDFAPPLVAVLDTYQDHGQDIDADGIYEYLNVTISVVPSAAGIVVAQGRLVDGAGHEIQYTESFAQMEQGSAQAITLSFNGKRIRVNGSNGPFELRDLLVYHTGDPIQSVAIGQAHTTAGYDYRSFEGPVDLVIAPSPTTVVVGEIFTMDILVQARIQPVDRVHVWLNFDMTKLLMVDELGDAASAIIADNSVLQEKANSVNNTTGEVNYEAEKPAGNPATGGAFRIATLRFKALSSALDTMIAFATAEPRDTQVALGGEDVLGVLASGRVTVAGKVLVFTKWPVKGAHGVDLGIQPVVEVRDSGATVTSDSSTVITLSINATASSTGALLTCTDGLSKVVSEGVATFAGCQVDRKGNGYVLEATAGGASPGTTLPFDVAWAGDTNGDCRVSVADYSRVVTHFGKNDASPDWNDPVVLASRADLNGDNKVGVIDFSLVVSKFGAVCPAP